MNVVVLNGNPDRENGRFDRYIRGYQLKLHKTGHYVMTFPLRDMLFTGYDDDTRYILTSLKEADLLIWAAPLKQGGLPLLTRMVQSLVNQHFQSTLLRDTNHLTNPQWMNRIPLIGIILQTEPETKMQDILLIRLAQERMAAELSTVMSFLITTETDLTEAVCETFRSFDYRRYIESTSDDFIADPYRGFVSN
jgi:hypothetical protein